MTMSAAAEHSGPPHHPRPPVEQSADVGSVGGEIDPPTDIRLFDTPEEAALAGWRSTPNAHAMVIAVEPGPSAGRVHVTVQTDGHPGFHDRDISLCGQTSGGKWWEIGSFGG